MANWIFPFYSTTLKTALNREQVAESVERSTYLSDAGYKRSPDDKKYFFGTVSSQEFELESLESQENLTRFAEGSIRGIGNEIYIFLRLRGFQYRRTWAAMMIFEIAALVALVTDVAEHGFQTLFQPQALIFLAVISGILGYVIYTSLAFQKKIDHTVNVFRGMLDADVTERKNVPLIFRR